LADDDEDEESDATMPGDSNEEDEDDEEEDEESSGDEVQIRQRRVTLTPRTPDPKASRYSSRAEARKPVNYSKKYHPQDHSIPGRRHLALMPTPTGDEEEVRPQTSQKRKRTPHVEVISDGVVSDEDADLDESIPARGQHRPRKVLKSITNNTQDLKGSKKTTKDARAARQTSSPRNEDEDVSNSDDRNTTSVTDGHDDLVAMAFNFIDGLEQTDLHDIPEYVKDKFAFKHRDEPEPILTRDAAVELMLEDFRPPMLVPMIIKKPYLLSEVESARQASGTPEHSSTTLVGDSDQSSTSTIAGDSSLPGALSTVRMDEDVSEHQSDHQSGHHSERHSDHQPSFHFDEAMAVTDIRNGQSSDIAPSARISDRGKEDQSMPSTVVQSSQPSAGSNASTEL
jgi:hypothetical protein